VALRARGWRKVVVAGQSRGAWNSLQVLDTPGLADAVIAISPASFTGTETQGADFNRILNNARSPAARVAVVRFKGDIYVQDLNGRASEIRDRLRPRVAALLVIDQPAGITGHGGGCSGDFARRYSACLLRFVIDPVPPADCGAAQ
jgi:pimeloyl-ACP methyl ester carboxylesterase